MTAHTLHLKNRFKQIISNFAPGSDTEADTGTDTDTDTDTDADTDTDTRTKADEDADHDALTPAAVVFLEYCSEAPGGSEGDGGGKGEGEGGEEGWGVGGRGASPTGTGPELMVEGEAGEVEAWARGARGVLLQSSRYRGVYYS